MKINPILIAAIALVIIIIVWNSRSKAQAIDSTGGSNGMYPASGSNSVNSGSTGTPSYSPPANIEGYPVLGKNTVLSRGAYGYEVKLIQEAYNLYYAPSQNASILTLDGEFGPNTESAIESSSGKRSISYNDYFNSVTGFGNVYDAISGVSEFGTDEATEDQIMDGIAGLIFPWF